MGEKKENVVGEIKLRKRRSEGGRRKLMEVIEEKDQIR